MSKIKVLVINLILSVLLFHVADLYLILELPQYDCFLRENSNGNILVDYIKYYHKFHNYSPNFAQHINKLHNNLLSDNYAAKNEENDYNKFRPIENLSAGKSIVVFGCSYTYGLNLKNNETFSSLLGKQLPNYKIYNRSKCGWATSHMLYQLEHKNFSNIPNVKYVLYLFITDHINRNFNSYLLSFTPYYKLNNDNTLSFQKYSLKYIESPLSLLMKTTVHRRFYDSISSCQEKNNYSVNLTKTEILSSKVKAEQCFPKSKFIVLRYDSHENEPYNWMFEDLKKEGCLVVSLKDLSDKNFLAPEYCMSLDDIHPNPKAWKEIVPLFVKYLQSLAYLKD